MSEVINWQDINEQWTAFWRSRGPGLPLMDGVNEFWENLGGKDAYLEIDQDGFETPRLMKAVKSQSDQYEQGLRSYLYVNNAPDQASIFSREDQSHIVQKVPNHVPKPGETIDWETLSIQWQAWCSEVMRDEAEQSSGISFKSYEKAFWDARGGKDLYFRSNGSRRSSIRKAYTRHEKDAAWISHDEHAKAIEELTEAIRLTAEYTMQDILPALPGWDWYDALCKYAPEKAEEFIARDIHGRPS